MAMFSHLLVVCVGVTSAIRHVEDGLVHHLAAEDLKLSDLKRSWTRAVTPVLSDEDLRDLRELKGRKSASAMQLEGCKDSKFEETGEKLGEGAYGAVYKVRKKSDSYLDALWAMSAWTSEYYAMKVPLEDDLDAEDAAVHEISVMAATQKQHCDHVLPLLEKDPCVHGEKKVNAFVTKLMPYDLDKWQREYEVPEGCFDVIYDAVRSGLDCMHAANLLHGDLKPDNVLFESFDEDGCPAGIQLADFGLSAKLGSKHLKFPKDGYAISWHEAGSVFNGAKDTFKLTKRVKVGGKYKMHYIVDKRLDECSFAMLMMELFDRRVPALQEELGKGACGAMGPDRQLMMP